MPLMAIDGLWVGPAEGLRVYDVASWQSRQVSEVTTSDCCAAFFPWRTSCVARACVGRTRRTPGDSSRRALREGVLFWAARRLFGAYLRSLKHCTTWY